MGKIILLSIDIAAVQKECDTNFIAPINLINLFTDQLKNQPESAIVNITSGLTQTSVKVFEIAPPIVDTELDSGARDQRGQRDRGMKPEEFAIHAIAAIKDDVSEAAIGFAANLRLKREELFNQLNPKK